MKLFSKFVILMLIFLSFSKVDLFSFDSKNNDTLIYEKQDPDDLAGFRIDSIYFETLYDETTNEATWYFKSGVDIYSYLTMNILEECNLIFSTSSDFAIGTTYVVPQDVNALEVGLNSGMIIADMDEVSNVLYGVDTSETLDYYAKIELVLSDDPYTYYTDYVYVTDAIYDYRAPFLYDVQQLEYTGVNTGYDIRTAAIKVRFKYSEGDDQIELITNLNEASNWLSLVFKEFYCAYYNQYGKSIKMDLYNPYSYSIDEIENTISFNFMISDLMPDSEHSTDLYVHLKYNFIQTRCNSSAETDQIVISTNPLLHSPLFEFVGYEIPNENILKDWKSVSLEFNIDNPADSSWSFGENSWLLFVQNIKEISIKIFESETNHYVTQVSVPVLIKGTNEVVITKLEPEKTYRFEAELVLKEQSVLEEPEIITDYFTTKSKIQPVDCTIVNPEIFQLYSATRWTASAEIEFTNVNSEMIEDENYYVKELSWTIFDHDSREIIETKTFKRNEIRYGNTFTVFTDKLKGATDYDLYIEWEWFENCVSEANGKNVRTSIIPFSTEKNAPLDYFNYNWKQVEDENELAINASLNLYYSSRNIFFYDHIKNINKIELIDQNTKNVVASSEDGDNNLEFLLVEDLEPDKDYEFKIKFYVNDDTHYPFLLDKKIFLHTNKLSAPDINIWTEEPENVNENDTSFKLNIDVDDTINSMSYDKIKRIEIQIFDEQNNLIKNDILVDSLINSNEISKTYDYFDGIRQQNKYIINVDVYFKDFVKLYSLGKSVEYSYTYTSMPEILFPSLKVTSIENDILEVKYFLTNIENVKKIEYKIFYDGNLEKIYSTNNLNDSNWINQKFLVDNNVGEITIRITIYSEPWEYSGTLIDDESLWDSTEQKELSVTLNEE